MKFNLIKTDSQSNARTGEIITDRGSIQTPVFMPVATLGDVKGVHFQELHDLGTQIILGNTYHLYLRPGLEILGNPKGLHGFNGWNKPMLTDSGGYQVYSLADIRKIEEDGVRFQSHIDGSKHFFTPEKVIDIQRVIGADIMMAFDECTPYPCDYSYAKKSMELTHRWLDRSFKRYKETVPLYGKGQTLFPIVQGSVYKDLRKQSIDTCMSYPSVGIAVGGLAVGEPTEELYHLTAYCCDKLPKDRARYLMGVGTPANLLQCIEYGIDMFDCVMPTRNGRNGMLFTMDGIINIKNNKWKDDFSLLDANSFLHVDRTCTKAFLRHLTTTNEMLAAQISSLHNLHFYIQLMKTAREKIKKGVFKEWKDAIFKQLQERI